VNGAADFIAALVIAALAGMGVGGGGLLVLWLTFISGAEQLTAQGVNIIFYICATAASLIVHLKNRKLPVAAILIMAIAGAAGAVGGCIVADIIEADLLRRLFGGLLAIAGASVFLKKSEN
jgi:uncharacterized membrane protein YfcA